MFESLHLEFTLELSMSVLPSGCLSSQACMLQMVAATRDSHSITESSQTRFVMSRKGSAGQMVILTNKPGSGAGLLVKMCQRATKSNRVPIRRPGS